MIYFFRRLKAWRVAGDGPRSSHKNAVQADQIFEEMIEMYNNGDNFVKPNAKTFAMIIHSWVNSESKVACDKAQEYYDLMLDMYQQELENHDNETSFVGTLKPNRYVMNALLKAYNFRSKSKMEYAALSANSILDEMIEGLKNGDTDMCPNGASFISCINAWGKTKREEVGVKSEEIFTKMIDLYNDAVNKKISSGESGNKENEMIINNLKPNINVCNSVLYSISRARDGDKAQRAYQFLQQIKDLDESLSIKPNLRTYNLVLDACAYTHGSFASHESKKIAYEVAIRTFHELNTISRSTDGTKNDAKLVPNHITYGMFLRACQKLMPRNEQREQLVERVFRKACKDGMCNDFVLSEFQKVASNDLFCNILGITEMPEDFDINVPVEWSQNINM